MSRVEEVLGERIVGRRPLGGGSIHDTARIETESGRVFVLKESSPGEFFEAEADGLRTLAASGAIRVPRVEAVGKSFLVIEWIESAAKSRGFFEAFGAALARMHRTTSDLFGHERNNFIGALPQDNAREKDLATFFAERRFRALLRVGGKALDRRLVDAVERVCDRLPELFAPIDEPPALLHGDLWGGNYLAASLGAVLIDPAVYFGPREADLAMTRLFGGFQPVFYAAYEREYPLPRGWRARVELFNLYHLLTHTIMFAGGYGSQALGVAMRYTRTS